MNKLIGFGCSWTFGLGMIDNYREDNLILPEDKPSKYAWPQVMADLLNWEVDNQGIAAASNLQILLSILNYDYKEGDHVAVMWTYTNRDLLLYEDCSEMQVAAFMCEDWFESLLKKVFSSNYRNSFIKKNSATKAKEFYKLHSENDLERRSWIYQYLAGLHLKSLNIPFVFITDWTSSKSLPKGVIDFSANPNEGFRRLASDKAKNGTHPGIESQKTFANYILDRSNFGKTE
jgi:hypothetical protein